MPDAVYNWPVTCACRTNRASGAIPAKQSRQG
jgi:hypothetical protein